MDFSMRSWLMPFLTVLICCSSNPHWEEQFVTIDSTLDSIVAQEQMVLAEVDKLWDSTTMVLEKSIPADFPEVDRNIFLTSRNADHITMFKSFNLLDEATQQLVHDAKKKDALLAKQLMELMDERKRLDTEMKQLLAAVAKEDTNASKAFSTRFQANESERSKTDNQ